MISQSFPPQFNRKQEPGLPGIKAKINVSQELYSLTLLHVQFS